MLAFPSAVRSVTGQRILAKTKLLILKMMTEMTDCIAFC